MIRLKNIMNKVREHSGIYVGFVFLIAFIIIIKIYGNLVNHYIAMESNKPPLEISNIISKDADGNRIIAFGKSSCSDGLRCIQIANDTDFIDVEVINTVTLETYTETWQVVRSKKYTTTSTLISPLMFVEITFVDDEGRKFYMD